MRPVLCLALAACWTGNAVPRARPDIVVVHRRAPVTPTCLFTTTGPDGLMVEPFPDDPDIAHSCGDTYPNEDYWWCRSTMFEAYTIRLRTWVEAAVERCAR